mmetsp:Transcript_9651/g.27920  ORF Transcript_9651/g.27920 Transcript_9651/m.27920 type:complete len:263 (+) Transcript_9651:197-985(+)
MHGHHLHPFVRPRAIGFHRSYHYGYGRWQPAEIVQAPGPQRRLLRRGRELEQWAGLDTANEVDVHDERHVHGGLGDEADDLLHPGLEGHVGFAHDAGRKGPVSLRLLHQPVQEVRRCPRVWHPAQERQRPHEYGDGAYGRAHGSIEGEGSSESGWRERNGIQLRVVLEGDDEVLQPSMLATVRGEQLLDARVCVHAAVRQRVLPVVDDVAQCHRFWRRLAKSEGRREQRVHVHGLERRCLPLRPVLVRAVPRHSALGDDRRE